MSKAYLSDGEGNNLGSVSGALKVYIANPEVVGLLPIWRYGSGVPSNSLGNDGDFYLNTATSDVYYKLLGAWTLIVNIKGASGATGLNFDVTGTLGSPSLITNSTSIGIIAASRRQRTYVAGNGGPVAATLASPDTIGQEWWIVGTSDTNTVAISNGGNVILNGDKTLARGSILKLVALDLSTWAEDGYNGL